MRVKELITELLDMPMYSEVQIVYVNNEYEYEYQDIFSTVLYNDDDTVGLVGVRD